MMGLAYHLAAQAELEAEVDSCERERRGAGDHVHADIADTLRMLREFPSLGRLDDDGTRRMVTRRNHFVVHYEIADERLIIGRLLTRRGNPDIGPVAAKPEFFP